MEFGAKKQKQKSTPETKSRSNLNPISHPSADSFFAGASLAYCFAFSFRRKLRTGVRALASIRGGLIGIRQKRCIFSTFCFTNGPKYVMKITEDFLAHFGEPAPTVPPRCKRQPGKGHSLAIRSRPEHQAVRIRPCKTIFSVKVGLMP